jgi:EAL domain-containing protein (putative c-di-GMP-specific phosphodiesterase class I)
MLKCSPKTRVVALSAHASRTHVTAMLAAGAVGYLTKVLDIDIVGSIRAASRGEVVLAGDIAGQVVGALSDRLVFEERLRTAKQARASYISSLIHSDSFAVAFQPVFDLRRGIVSGIEGLARFPSDNGRGPDILIAEAWTLGLGLELELAIVAKALRSAERLPPRVFLAVNISPAAAMSDQFVALITGASRPSSIVVELTEHAVVEDYEMLNQHLDKLRARGVRVAVDDVGAGFASLRHILRLHPDLIKLDVSLVSEINDNADQQALASSLISFAEKVHSPVVGEGIESPEQLKCLTELGVGYGQGFFLARPAPEIQVDQFTPLTQR